MTTVAKNRQPFLFIYILITVIAALGCGGGTATTKSGSSAGAANTVIVISVEGLRADHLGCYGAERATSPAIDSLAATGSRFEWAFTQSGDGPAATASLLTALYPTTHGVMDPGDGLVDEVPTMTEAFQAAGYEVGFFADGGSALTTPGLTSGIVNDASAAGTWLRAKAGSDLLLVLGLSTPLPPFAANDSFTEGLEAPPEGFVADAETLAAEGLTDAEMAWASALYDGEVKAVDTAIGELMAVVDELGLTDSTTVVVVGAHGLELGEHGVLTASLASPVTRIPLILRQAGGAGAGVVKKIVEVVDVMPTVLELVAVAGPEGMQGSSMLAIMNDESQPPYIAFAEAPSGVQMAALGGCMVLVDGDDSMSFFELSADPLALTDVAEGEEKRLGVMKNHLEAWGKMVAAASYDPARKGEELDEDDLDNLRSLGYIQ